MSRQLPVDPDILESYVLGLTSSEETARIEALKRESPDVAREVRELESSLETLGSAYSKTPRPSLKSEIWSSIQAASATNSNSSDKATSDRPSTSTSASPSPSTSTSTSPINTTHASWFSLPLVLLAGLSVCSIIAFIYTQRQATGLQTELDGVKRDLLTLRAHEQSTERNLVAATNELNFRNSSSTHAIPLTDVGHSSNIVARIYVNPHDTLRFVSLTEGLMSKADSHLILWTYNNHNFVAVMSCERLEPGKLISFNAVPPSSEFLLTWEISSNPRTPDKASIVAVSSKNVMLGFGEKRRSKGDGFIAGEPIRHNAKRPLPR